MGEIVFDDVVVMALIEQQRQDVETVFESVIAELVQRAAEHRETASNDRLAEAFDIPCTHSKSSVNRLAGTSRLWEVETLGRSLEELRDGLVRQDMDFDTFEFVPHLVTEIRHALAQRTCKLRGSDSELRSARVAHMTVFFVREKILELRALGREIDREDAG